MSADRYIAPTTKRLLLEKFQNMRNEVYLARLVIYAEEGPHASPGFQLRLKLDELDTALINITKDIEHS